MRAPPFLPSILMIASVAVLCSLGAWQLKRLAWKTQLIQAYDLTGSDARDDALDTRMMEGVEVIASGRIEGRFIDAPPIVVAPRTLDGRVGKHIYAPFALRSGGAVFVNMGWAPQDWDISQFEVSGASQILYGAVKPVMIAGYFTPENNPPNEWYWPDLAAMAHFSSIDEAVDTHVFYDQAQGEHEDYPRPLEFRADDLPNDHLGYAGFWFSLAGILIVIFILRFVRVSK